MTRKIVVEGINLYSLELANVLTNTRKDDVIILDSDKQACEEAANSLDVLVLNGLVKDKVLDNSHLSGFDVFIAASEDDGENLLSCSYVKDHYNIGKVMAIVQTKEYEETFANQGILTVNPEKATSKILLRYIAGDPKLTDRITMAGDSDLRTFEIKHKLDGKKISDIPLKEKNYNIVCMRRDKNTILAKPDYIMKEGDLLQLAFKPKDHKKLEKYFS